LIFALAYLIALLFPGFLIARALKLDGQPFLLCTSFSLIYFIALLVFAMGVELTVTSFYILYSTGLIILCCLNIISRRPITSVSSHQLMGYLLVGISSALYLFSVGLYDELPSDVYQHMEYFKEVSNQIKLGEFNTTNTMAVFSKSAKYWYHFPVLINNLINISFLRYVELFAAINVIVLLICIYEFTYWLFNRYISNKTELLVLSVLSVFFFATHFGINTFAFIRYYSIAPTILNYAIYLTSIICLFRYFNSDIKPTQFLIISGFLFCCAYLIHAQEAAFIGVSYFIIVLIVLLRYRLFKIQTNDQFETKNLPDSLFPFAIVIFLVSLFAYFFVVNEFVFDRISKPKILDIAKALGIGEDYFILNPRFQFYTVLTHWGFYIYILYILFYSKYFKNNAFILAGMLVPLVTVFNPLFSNLFLRIGYSEVLWRFLYMIPLYLVAARLTTGLCLDFISLNSYRRIINVLIIVFIFVFLLPLKFGTTNLPYSRIYSLSEPHFQARPAYWQDMFDFLNSLPNQENIVTDPVTGYMINALTKHRNVGYKFYQWRQKDKYNFDNYANDPLQLHKGKILIINQRKGMSTKIAKLAQHWPAHVLKLTDFYNDELITHIKDQSVHFEFLWGKNNIQIYRINY